MQHRAEPIGCEPYLDTLAQHFSQHVRLVTLVGAGGIGKTAIARQYHLHHNTANQSHGGAGSAFIDCSEVRSVDDLSAAIRQALGKHRNTGLIKHLLARQARLLLVLDGLEQCAAIITPALLEWTSAAPALQLLVTSRVALGLPFEFVLPIEPLALPQAPAAELQAPSPALRLLLQRGRQAAAAFELDAHNIDTAIAVVVALEGLPLAIELAAAKLRFLSLAQVLQRLSQPLDLLVHSQRDDRHSSMRRVVASSIDALDLTAQRAFAALAVFPSRFNYGAARAVIDAVVDGGAAAIDSLCEHSLLQSTSLRDGGTILRWATAVRQYAVEFADGRIDLGLCRRAHAAHFARQAAGAVIPGVSSDVRDEGLDDFVAAAQHAEQARDLMELTLAIDLIFERRARHRERIVLITNNLQRIGVAATGMQQQHAALLLSLGKAQRQVGDFAAANHHFEQAHTVGTQLNDPLIQALAICRQAELVATGGDTSKSRAMLRDAEALLRSADDVQHHRWAITAEIEVLFQTGHALRREGLLNAAARAYQKSYALATAIDNVEWLAALNYELGVIHLFHNRYSEARSAFNAALQMAKEADLVQIQAATHTVLGITAQTEGELQVALDHHVRAIQIFRDIGHPHREGSALYSLGCTYLELNDAPSALVVLRRASLLIQSVGAYRYDALIKMVLALAHHALNEPADADASLSAADDAAQFCPTEPALHAALTIAHFMVHGAANERAVHIEQAQALVTQSPGDDPQFVLRMLARSAAPANAAWIIDYHQATATLRFADDVSVSLQTRAPLRRLVEKLFELRLDQPGEDVGFDALIAVGWPNEQIALDAARNRLHVALSALRRLGLRDAIKSGPHGYHIDPLLTIRWRNADG